MNREWKVGDVALVEAGCWANRKIALRLAEGWAHVNGVSLDDTGIVTALRPLVVIDPEDREQVERLSEAIKDAEKDCGRDFWEYDQMALRSALREFADPKPPEPEEPTGLGAVVRDGTGETWVRSQWDMNFPWCKAEVGDFKAGDPSGEYRDIPRPVTILSPGWEPEQ